MIKSLTEFKGLILVIIMEKYKMQHELRKLIPTITS